MKALVHMRWQWLVAALVVVAGAWFVTAQDSFAVDSEVKGEPALTQGAELGKWTQDYDAALKLAKEKDMPLLLDFTGSDWCAWCKLMDRQVFADPKWDAYAKDHILLVKLDFPQDEKLVPEPFRERNQKLQQQFRVEGYPTFVLLSADGKTELGRLNAGPEKTAESFASEVKQVLRHSDSAVAAFVKQLKPETAKAYQDALATSRKLETDMHAWMATVKEESPEVRAKYVDFMQKIEAADDAAYTIEVEYLQSTLPAKKAAALRKLVEEETAAKQALQKWLSTDPQPTKENRATYGTMSGKVDGLHQQVEAFWN